MYVHYEYDKIAIAAIINGHLGIIKYLINNKNINTFSEYLLYKAAYYGQTEIVKYLVENGADIHMDVNTALKTAASYGFIDIIKYFIEDSGIEFDKFIILDAAIPSGQEIYRYLTSKVIG